MRGVFLQPFFFQLFRQFLLFFGQVFGIPDENPYQLIPFRSTSELGQAEAFKPNPAVALRSRGDFDAPRAVQGGNFQSRSQQGIGKSYLLINHNMVALALEARMFGHVDFEV